MKTGNTTMPQDVLPIAPQDAKPLFLWRSEISLDLAKEIADFPNPWRYQEGAKTVHDAGMELIDAGLPLDKVVRILRAIYMATCQEFHNYVFHPSYIVSQE